MSRSVILAFLSALAVMAVVSGTVEDTIRRVVDVLADASFEEWSATFIETNDKIAFSDQRSSSQTSRPTCPVAKTDTSVNSILVTETEVFADRYIAIHRIASPLDFKTYGRTDSKPSGHP
ncbi:hypothetical protein F2Q69_00057701 [Brassica cretica]|uniref:Uncharacterized protein n=1 Tax=Brassica cretica TaxID=69181 RepID=A0A8S9MZR0_BRACR|nr:hypothetical protein F2Q69_00057701 [Brassica cretica]